MFSLIVPFHSDLSRLQRVFEAADEAERHGIEEILLCHNGPPLADDARADLEQRSPTRARLLHTDHRGIGAGYRLGIEHARSGWCVLSASDLPFGFSDIDAFVAHDPRPRLAIGSKAHPRSTLQGWGLTRRVAGFGFYILRRLLLGPATPGDSQGTILIETELARRVLARVESNDYFFSLELITLAAAEGVTPVELPVRMGELPGGSSVHLLRDSMAMAGKTWTLRRRLRSQA